MQASLETAIAPRRRARAQSKAAPLDRAALDKAIAALHEKHRDQPEFRISVLELFRQALSDAHERARVALEASGKGLACAEFLSDAQDDLIRAIHAYVIRYVYPVNNPTSGEKLAITAVGGYGRSTLAPGSDIDLLFLFPQKQTAWGESVVEAILYVLWDLRLKVGHSTRSIDECLRQARADMTVRTALLEARFILGDEPLFEAMRGRFEQEVVKGSAREFVAAKLAERDQRISRAGSSRYLVEPNVKEGKGGLRDLNTLFWIAKYVYRVRRNADLVATGLFTPEELRLFERCDEFLWRVRCLLHFEAGRAEERMSFERQRVIAQKLGYTTHGGLSEVERFMKHYFLIAKDVGDLTAIVCAALEEQEAKPRAVLDRFVGRLRRRRKSIDSEDFSVEFDRVTIARPDVFEKNPVNFIRLFWFADQSGLAIHPDALRLVTRSLKLIDAKVRNSVEANRLFLDILTSRNTPETVLRQMNEAGVLGRFIPDFGRIVAMMQFNMYHHYTVDEHLLRTVGVLSQIEGRRNLEEHPLASEVLPSISNRTALYVALFLHDIAKGRPEDHSIEGAVVARKLCPRFGLSDAETDTVAWLIENHLVMSNVAQSRDLSDRRTIETFGALVQTLERLKMLLILTICDIRAVGPDVWNGWKGALLRTLYWETEVVLAGGHSKIDRKERVVRMQEELRRSLPGWSDPEFDAYALRHYPAYWLKVDLPRKIQHANLLHLTEVEVKSLATEVVTNAFRGITELTVVAPDHPFLLTTIAGACAAAGANIVDAQVFTTNDGLALDTIFISREFGMDEDELRRGQRIASSIEKSLRGDVRLSDLMQARTQAVPPRGNAFTLAPEVIIDNSLSLTSTVVEASGLDRPGLLFELTRVLSKLNLNIVSAHVTTFGEKAVDSFYVTDLTGLKIVNPARQGAIKRHLLEVFGGPERKQFRATE